MSQTTAQKTCFLKPSSPNYLILSLNRFSKNSSSKILTDVYLTELNVPFLENEYLIGGSNSCYYENYIIQSIIVHSGLSVLNGHYFVCCKDQHGKWKKINDNLVSDFQAFNKENYETPYIFVFKKKNQS
jgi:ubiquitin C-terminal hydrolase